MITEPICINCKHFDINTFTCKAFPKEIPEDIIIGLNNHSEPLPNQDNKIVFEQVDSNTGLNV